MSENKDDGDNVVRLVPKPADPRGEQRRSTLVELLEKTLEDAKAGNIHFLILTFRSPDGGMRVRYSNPVDEVQALGLLEVAKATILSHLSESYNKTTP